MDLDPSEVTSLLGIAPSRSGRKGDPVLRPTGEVERHRRVGSWILDLEPEADWTIEESISALLAPLPKDASVWECLSARYSIEIICYVFVHGVIQGFVLSPDLLRLVGSFGIKLGVDIFCRPDEEQAAGLRARLME